MAILGIVPDDDDGEAASRRSREVEPLPVVLGSEAFDMRNEAHKATFKAMLKEQFPALPESKYKTVAEVCHGRTADPTLLAALVSSFLAKRDNATM